jgi:putative transposase
VLNPVRAAIVKHPRQWAWSSYGAMIGKSPAPAWLSTDELLAEFGKQRAIARRKYQEFIADGMGAESIWKDLQGQIYLGDDNFVEQMRGKLGDRDEDVNIPRMQQQGPAPKLRTIRMQYKKRDDAILAAYETGAYSYQQIAKEFGVHFTTVGRVVRQTVRSTKSDLARK